MNIADIAERAINRAESDNGLYTRIAGNGVWYVWTEDQRGPATTSEGMVYLREGVLVQLDDVAVIVRSVADNGLNCGEARLTGFAATNADLIQGVIETAVASA